MTRGFNKSGYLFYIDAESKRNLVIFEAWKFSEQKKIKPGIPLLSAKAAFRIKTNPCRSTQIQSHLSPEPPTLFGDQSHCMLWNPQCQTKRLRNSWSTSWSAIPTQKQSWSAQLETTVNSSQFWILQLQRRDLKEGISRSVFTSLLLAG